MLPPSCEISELSPLLFSVALWNCMFTQSVGWSKPASGTLSTSLSGVWQQTGILNTESARDGKRIWSSWQVVSTGPTSTDAEDRLRIPKSSADFGILVGQGLGTDPLRILRSHCVVPPGGKPFSLPPGICDSHTPHAYIRVSLPVR